jgi:hypothetical protein
VTTQLSSFLDTCREYREGIRPKTHKWHERLAGCFTDPKCKERYEAGEFLYCAHDGPGEDPDYGDAVVPRKFFEEYWGGLGFRLLEWDESQTQARATLQK